MPKSLRKHELAAPEPAERPVQSNRSGKSQNSRCFLSPGTMPCGRRSAPTLSADLILKQLDSIDELVRSTPSGQAAIVLWDARNHRIPPAYCRA